MSWNHYKLFPSIAAVRATKNFDMLDHSILDVEGTLYHAFHEIHGDNVIAHVLLKPTASMNRTCFEEFLE